MKVKNATFNSQQIKSKCETKGGIKFTTAKEQNGRLYIDGYFVARITIPKGRKFVPPKTYKSMAGQLLLNVDEFDEFLECTLSREAFLKRVSEVSGVTLPDDNS